MAEGGGQGEVAKEGRFAGYLEVDPQQTGRLVAVFGGPGLEILAFFAGDETEAGEAAQQDVGACEIGGGIPEQAAEFAVSVPQVGDAVVAQSLRRGFQ